MSEPQTNLVRIYDKTNKNEELPVDVNLSFSIAGHTRSKLKGRDMFLSNLDETDTANIYLFYVYYNSCDKCSYLYTTKIY